MNSAPPPRIGAPVPGAGRLPLLPFDGPRRVHIIGASGSGTTSLARALAAHWSVPCMDTDDFYWLPTNPPFRSKRPAGERLDLMQRLFLPRDAWVLSGSLVGWGDAVLPYVDAVVLLRLDPAERMDRLHRRETQRYGAEALAPGGAQHDAYQSFMEWAAGYDDPEFTGRSRAQHLHWLARAQVPWVELDSSLPTCDLCSALTGDSG